MAMRITRLTYALLAFCLFLATRLGAESVWTIPGIVNARGLNAVTGSGLLLCGWLEGRDSPPARSGLAGGWRRALSAARARRPLRPPICHAARRIPRASRSGRCAIRRRYRDPELFVSLVALPSRFGFAFAECAEVVVG